MFKPGHRAIQYLVVAVVAVFLTALLSFFFKSEIDEAIYEERKESLVQMINTSARAVNDNVSTQWEIAKVYENDLYSHLSEYETVNAYMAYLNTQLSNDRDFWFLVDSVGNYYCSDGKDGKINNTKYFLAGTEDKLEYLDSLPHFDNDITYLILRTRLAHPIQTRGENGAVTVTYCCLMHDLTTLNEHISSLFDGNNNTMIYDTDSGIMLYKQFGIRRLVEGYNVYGKYEKINLVYDKSAQDIIDRIQSKQTVVSLMDLEGEEYYLCSSPLSISNWSIFLVVNGTFFDSTSHYAFTGIIYSIVAILLVASCLFVLLAWYLNKLKYSSRIIENERKATEAIREAYQIKSNFLSYMSHDIRTPINGIIGMSNVGIANSAERDKVEECFGKIVLSGKHLLAIVNDVLDMSAIEAGKVVIQEEQMNVTDTLRDCISIIRGSLDKRELTLAEDYNCPVSDVTGDAFHLKQIIINLLSNAVKFTEDGGTVTLSCRQLAEKDGLIPYEIAVRDTGIGMTEEFQQHIFEAFRTATKESKTKYKGSGLGMAISREYVELMHGTITVESRLNEGSTFTVVLPFRKSERPADELQLEEMHVLLVDDNEINLEITQEMLKDRVKSVCIAHNGKEAVDAFLGSTPGAINLILMDVMMPVMNGLEAAKAIRTSDRPDKDVFIIALTANTYKDDVDAIFLAGIDGYLTKPFFPEQLIEKIKLRKRE